MEHLAGLIGERGLAQKPGRGRDGQLLVRQRRMRPGQRPVWSEGQRCDGLVNWQRLVKSDLEVAFIRRAARIVERMHALIFEMVEPGLPKNRLVAEIYKVAIEGTEGHFGDYPAIVPMLPSGMDATAPHLTWDDRPFEAGEGTFFEIAGCYRRYHCPLSRTVSAQCPRNMPMPSGRC